MTIRSVEIRSAVLDDAESLAALAIQVWLEAYATEGVSIAMARHVFATFTPQSFSDLVTDPACLLYVAESRGDLLGLSQLRVGVSHPLVTTRAPGELERLYIQARHCRRGLGRRLLEQTEESARAEGTRTAWSTVWVENVAALQFYAALGYEEIGEVPFRFEEQEVRNRLLVKSL